MSQQVPWTAPALQPLTWTQLAGLRTWLIDPRLMAVARCPAPPADFWQCAAAFSAHIVYLWEVVCPAGCTTPRGCSDVAVAAAWFDQSKCAAEGCTWHVDPSPHPSHLRLLPPLAIPALCNCRSIAKQPWVWWKNTITSTAVPLIWTRRRMGVQVDRRAARSLFE